MTINLLPYFEVGGCAGLHFLIALFLSDHLRDISIIPYGQHKGIGVIFGVGTPQDRLFIRLINRFALADGDLSFIEDQFQLDHQNGEDSRDEDEGGDASAGVGDLVLLSYAPESALWEHADGCEEGRQ